MGGERIAWCADQELAHATWRHPELARGRSTVPLTAITQDGLGQTIFRLSARPLLMSRPSSPGWSLCSRIMR
jgi:hypothetical protein